MQYNWKTSMHNSKTWIVLTCLDILQFHIIWSRKFRLQGQSVHVVWVKTQKGNLLTSRRLGFQPMKLLELLELNQLALQFRKLLDLFPFLFLLGTTLAVRLFFDLFFKFRANKIRLVSSSLIYTTYSTTLTTYIYIYTCI